LKSSGRARHARRLAVRSAIGALIVAAGLSGSIIGVAAGETLSNRGQVRPPDVTNQASTTAAEEKAQQPRKAKKKRHPKTTTTTIVVAPEQAPALPEPVIDPDSSFHRGWWVVTLVERNGSSSATSSPHQG
jgi:hypothetical protein